MVNPQEKNYKVLCVWEIGGDLGHISSFAKIVKALEKDGYQVVVALQDLSRAYPLFCDTRATLLQAPVWLPKITLQRPIACLPDTLLLLGYLEVDPLHALVIAWQNLVDLVQPDLVIFDYSPTAMLALQHRSLAKLLIGTGFADPAPGHPIADWRPVPVADGLVARQESRVLQQVNAVLTRQGKPQLVQLADLFAADKVLLKTFPELDLYQCERKNARYCIGSSPQLSDSKVRFASNNRPRILAYLKPHYSQMELLLSALAGCNADIFIACPQGRLEQFQVYLSDSFQVSVDMVNLQDGLAEADLFVCHGNGNSIKESLCCGTPALVLPIQLEQLLTGKKIQECGFGLLLQQLQTVDDTRALLDGMLADKEQYRTAIAQMLARYPEPRLSLPDAVVAACAELLVADL